MLISVRRPIRSRREIRWCAVANPRPAPVGGRRTNNCTALASRRVFICFHGERGLVGIHLTRQTGELARVSRVFEEDHVVGVKTDCSNMLVSVKQVVNEKEDADVAMVRALSEQVGDGAVGLVHEIVDHQQRWLPAVKVCLLYTSPSPRD